MRALLAICFGIFLVTSARSQQLVAPSTVTCKHDSDCLADQGVNDSVLIIQIEDGFADSMKVVVDGKIVKQGYFQSDHLQSTHQLIWIPRNSNSIDLIIGNSGVHIIPLHDYKYLAISKYRGMWILTYGDCTIVHD